MVADHLSRKNEASDNEAQVRPRPIPAGRAARAAARVAARYANAPSYSQMLAEEARNAMRAAQAAQQAAEDAHAAVQMVLAGIEAANSAESVVDLPVEPEQKPISQFIAPQNLPETADARECLQAADPADPVSAASDLFVPQPGDEQLSAVQSEAANTLPLPPITEADEPALPIFANLIQFPREMIATRRLRPRRAEGPLADHEMDSQLSIFEVDPAAVSTQPAAPAVEEPAAPEWMRPEWPAVELDPQPREGHNSEPAPLPKSCAVVDLASLNRRILALVVDACLTVAAFSGVIAVFASAARYISSPRVFEVSAAIVFLLVLAGYQSLFSSATMTTPGMWYAGIGLCTLDGYVPARAQRYARLLALPLSVLPLGLGLAWAVFDEDRLTWHDRLSGTYLRRR